MAKRKRLTPPNPDFLTKPDQSDGPGTPSGASANTSPNGLPNAPLAPDDATTASRPAPRSGPRARGLVPIADVAGEAAAVAALEEVTETLSRAREEGRMVLTLPLEAIDVGYLMRDRLPFEEGQQNEDMTALIESLRQRGQQTPIEVAPLAGGRYGLISGWRRCAALQHLAAETGEARFTEVLALIRRPDEADSAYVAMVEENEIRVGLSFYERARIVARTVENGVYPDHGAALRGLFATASRAKRSKIKSFISIVEALDGTLRFPQAIGERLGLRLSKALTEDPRLAARLTKALSREAATGPEEEARQLEAAFSKKGKKALKPKIEPVQSHEIAPGLNLNQGRDGLTLAGPALTDDLQKRLVAWLKSELN